MQILSPFHASRKLTPPPHSWSDKSWTERRSGIFTERIRLSPKMCDIFQKVCVFWNLLWHSFLPSSCPQGFPSARCPWWQIGLLRVNCDQWVRTGGILFWFSQHENTSWHKHCCQREWEFYFPFILCWWIFFLGNRRINGIVAWLEQSNWKRAKMCSTDLTLLL